LSFIGASIGTWRFAAIAQKQAKDAYDKFEYEYIHQKYPKRPTLDDLYKEVTRTLDAYLDDKGINEILTNPQKRLNILATHCTGPAASENALALFLVLAGGHVSNIIKRESLGKFFKRTLLYDPRDIPPFFHMNSFPIHKAPITKENMKASILASGSVPFLMEGIKDIPGAPPGIYRDGGIIDYHLDIPFINDDEGIVLFPHYMERIIPTWFDKKIPWKKPMSENMDRVVVVCPSRSFVNTLPGRRIPNKYDFRFSDAKRIGYWKKIVKRCEHLGEVFMEAVESGKIKDKIKSLKCS
jgi:hypothetical protein